jgi:LysR family nitrogen assimilation transcriptional regulator
LTRDFTIHQYRVFLRAAESGSITRAANALSLPQPSVSRSISRIESTLNVQLIERFRQGVTLTPAGQKFYEHALEAIRQFDLAKTAAIQDQGGLTGEITLAAPESFAGVVFVPLVSRFQQTCPDARLRLMMSASILIPNLIDNGVVDMGIIADTHSAPAMPTEALCQESFYLVSARDDPNTSAATVPLQSVSGLPLFLNAMRGGFRARIDEAFHAEGLDMNVAAEIDANEPLLDLVLDRSGYTILPFSAIARKSRAMQYSASRIVSPAIYRNLKLVTAPSRTLSRIGQKTLGLVKRIVRESSSRAKWVMAE